MSSAPSRPGFAFWATVVLVVAALYVASSGPTLIYAARRPAYATVYESQPRRLPLQALTIHPVWLAAYRPLVWINDSSLGYPLSVYWNLFPIRGDGSIPY